MVAKTLYKVNASELSTRTVWQITNGLRSAGRPKWRDGIVW